MRLSKSILPLIIMTLISLVSFAKEVEVIPPESSKKEEVKYFMMKNAYQISSIENAYGFQNVSNQIIAIPSCIKGSKTNLITKIKRMRTLNINDSTRLVIRPTKKRLTLRFSLNK